MARAALEVFGLRTFSPGSAPPAPACEVKADTPMAFCSCPPAPSPLPPAEKPAKARTATREACAPVAIGAVGLSSNDARSPNLQHDLFSVAAEQKDSSLELELLILGRVALDEERNLDALGHAQRHAQLYPGSAFQEERLAIQVLAGCAAGYRERAGQRLEELLRLSPGSTYLPRIRETCGEDLPREAEPETASDRAADELP